MKLQATGIVRKLDGLGRLVIPMELRKVLKISKSDPLEIFTTDDGAIVVRPYRLGCACCGNTEGLAEFNGMVLCSSCIKGFSTAIFSDRA